jgi:L-ribulose-5-phosphate 3-epimerase
MHRREFLRQAAAAAALTVLPRLPRLDAHAPAPEAGAPPQPFRISLAEWSLEKSLRAKKLDNLDFPRVARKDLGIEIVEYVDQFFRDKAEDAAYIAELRKRCEDEGVRSGLIMVDTAGRLAAADAAERMRAVEGHGKWIDAAKALGCHTIRVNAWGEGTPEEMRARMVESAGRLAELGAQARINVVIENHGGPSSDPEWLTGILRQVDSPWLGALPDFGNFPASIDRFAAVERLMPWAKGVSSKGDATSIPRMIRIALDASFRGTVGVESGASAADGELEAARTMKAILDEARSREPALKPIFDGRGLDGWAKVAGGEWAVEDGTLTGRNGTGWSTDPERTGSWLRTEKEYGDFELYLEVALEPGTNSGVFLRAGPERNPAFTGYEVQLVDRPGVAPSKGGPGSLYDFAAPRKNLIRPAREWNELRVIARGPSIRVHLNGEMIVDAKVDRRPRGFIGLQAHDARSVARFRRIFLVEV